MVYVIKLGGSIITNKSGRFELDRDRLVRFAQAILNVERLKNKLVLVLGGGSFGNRVLLEYGLCEESAAVDCCVMHQVMNHYASTVAQVFGHAGIACFPVSIWPWFGVMGGETTLWTSLQELLFRGVTPILTGDFIPDGQSSWRTISSDEVAAKLGVAANATEIIVFTDVPGVHISNNDEIFERIGPNNARDAMVAASCSKQPDATGGMLTKLRHLLWASKNGLSSLILDGRDPTILERIFDVDKRQQCRFTRVEPGCKIEL